MIVSPLALMKLLRSRKNPSPGPPWKKQQKNGTSLSQEMRRKNKGRTQRSSRRINCYM